MAWDKNLPNGGADIAQGDNSIRDNNAALETAINAEHEFSTGGVNSGRHKFGSGNNAARNAITTWVAGSVWFNTEVRAGSICLQRYSGSAWVNLDIFDADVPRLGEQSVFTVAQFAQWAQVVPGAGSPDTLAIDLANSPKKYATIVGDTIISNPTNPVSSCGTNIELDLTMSGAGHVITFGNEYKFIGGITPAIASSNGAKTKVFISSLQSGGYLLTTAPGIA